MYSWPGVQFLLKGRPPWTIAGGPCAITSRSVAQIATASMRTSTSARFGTGTGLSVSFSSPGSPSTHARMVSGTGMSLHVFTPGGVYIGSSLLLRRCRRMRLRSKPAKLGGECPHRGGDLLAHERQMILLRPHGWRRCADRTDNGAITIADRRADADDAGLIL